MGLSLGSASGFEEGRMNPKYSRKQDPYRVFYNWEITHFCNYNCPYCSVYSRKKDFKYCTEFYEKVWSRLFEKYGTGHIRISGGEPSTHPEIVKIMEMLSKKFTMELSTNLTFNIDNFISKVSPDTILVSSSFHPYCEDFNKFFSKVVKLKEKGYDTSVTYVAFPGFNEKIPGYKEKFESNGIQFIVQIFSGHYKEKKYPQEYSLEEKDFLKKITGKMLNSTNKVICEEKLNPKKPGGRTCRMGQMYAKIFPDGKAYRCCVTNAEYLGNVFEEDFRLLDRPKECFAGECPCYKAMIPGKEKEWLKHWEYRWHPEWKRTDNG